MSCLIQYNNEGLITGVKDSSGKASELFLDIASIPTVSAEQAVEIYKRTLSEAVLEDSKIFFKSDDGNIHYNYKDALKASNSIIQVVAASKEATDVTLAELSANTNPTTKTGLINNLINLDMVESSDLIEGKKVYNPQGHSVRRQVVSKALLREQVRANNFGKYDFKQDSFGSFTLEDKVQLKNLTYEEIKSKYGQELADSKLANDLATDIIDNYSLEGKYRPQLRNLSEKQLRNQLTELMSSMGINLMSIENYKKAYKHRNGVEIGAEAFADIANSVIAMKNEDIDTSTLMEEVLHFVLEGMDQTQVSEALEEVVNTNTYSEQSEVYRERYKQTNPSLTEAELETLVRKEILAKEITKNLTEPQESQSFLTALIERIKEFLTRLIVNEGTVNKIDNITEAVSELIIKKNIESSVNMDQIRRSNYLMYSIENNPTSAETSEVNTILNKLLNLAESAEKLIRNDRNTGGSSRIKKLKRAASKIQNNIDIANSQLAISEVLDVINSKVDYLKDAFKQAEKQDLTLGKEEHNLLEQLTTIYKPSLNAISAKVGGDTSYNKINRRIENALSEINKMEGRSSNFNTNTVEKLVRRLLERSPRAAEFGDNKGAFDKFVDNMVERVNQHNKDTGSLYMYYGQITHAADPYLNLGGAIIADLYNDFEFKSTEEIKAFVSQLEELLGSPEKLNDLLKNEGSNKIAHQVDYEKFNTALNKEKVKAHLEALKADGMTKEEVTKAEQTIKDFYDEKITYKELDNSGLSLHKSPTREVIYNEEFTYNTLDMIERVFNKEYYVEQRKNFKEYKLSPVTRVALADFSSRRGEISARGRDELGTFWSSRSLKNEQDSLNELRKQAESPLNNITGEPKEGLELLLEDDIKTKNIQGDIVKVEEGLYVKYKDGVTPSNEAIVAFELIRMKQIREQKRLEDEASGKATPMYRNERLSEMFLEKLKEMESDPDTSRKEIKDFVLYNMNIDIVGDFWEQFTGGLTNAKIAEQVISDGNASPQFIEWYRMKKKATLERSVIQKSYRDSKDGTNTKVTRMSSDVVERLMELNDTIDMLEKNMKDESEEYRRITESRDYERKENSENTPNQDWYAYLDDNGVKYNLDNIKAIYDLAKPHITSTVTMRVQDSIQDLINISSGLSSLPKDKTQKQIQRTFGTDEIITPENAAEWALKLIENSLARHFQSTAPKGLNGLLNEIHSSKGRNISEILTDISNLDNIALSNHYSLYEGSESDFINKAYDNRRTGERFQANLRNTEFQNKEFMSKVNMKVNMETGELIKDPNNNLQKAHDLYIEMMMRNSDLYNTSSDISVYDKINVRQSQFDSTMRLIGGKDTKNIIKERLNDFLKYRVDEMEMGDVDTDGKLIREKTSMKTFPKPFVRALEDPKTRTEDNLFALVTFTKAAHMYNSRNDFFGDIMALKNSMLDRGSVDGKPAGTTNSYKMLNNYVDSTFFGINETANRKVKLPLVGEVDIAKLFSQLHSFIRWKNLSYNIVVPLTSYFTSRIGLAIEERTGQYIDKHSVKMARKKFTGNFLGASKEAFNLNSKNYLNVLGEHLGFFDFTNRFENSGRSKLARFMSKMGFGLHTAANFEPLSLAMMSNLYGHRIYSGKVVDFNTYRKLTKQDSKAAMAGWESLKDLTMAEYIKVENGKVYYDYLKFQQDTGIETLQEAEDVFNESLLAVRNRGKKLIERIDGTIKSEERTMLQRNFFGKFVMTHKGWLAIALANKFKYQHFNYQTMMEEEGSYVTGAKQISGSMKDLVKIFKGQKTFNEAWAEMIGSKEGQEEYIKQNMRRNLVEFSIASTVFMLAALVSGYADDDDEKDNYFAQFSAYMLERMNNEQNSQQFGLYSEVYKTLKEPIVGMEQIVDMFNITQAFNTDDKKSGRYKGVPTYQAWIINNLAPSKQLYQLMNTENLRYQKNAYQHFNPMSQNQVLSLLVDDTDVSEFIQKYK